VPLEKHEKRCQFWLPALTWAAGELLLTTGESRYNDFVTDNAKALTHWSNQAMRWWAYLCCDPALVDRRVQGELRRKLLEAADRKVVATDEAAYRMGNGRGTACGWGACQGANHGDLLLRAYALTGQQKYLDAACLNADWHLGANPLSKTLLTGMGVRHPRRPEISWLLYEDPDRDMSGATVKGIAIYGIGPPLRSYPGHPGDEALGIPRTGWPLWRSWRDVWDHHAEIYSEFTIRQTCGPAAILYATLYALEKEAGLVPDDCRPNPLVR
jgi:endoglucanase